MEKAKKPNLFSSLYHWAHSGSENFCTEALVWLINQLLDKGESAGQELLSRLCFGKKDLDRLGEVSRVLTQFRTERHGIPDILIKTTKLLAIIEVKVGAGLGENQLTDYREYLNEKKGDGEGRLILLEREKTRDSDLDLDNHCSWFEVGDWLRKDESVKDQAAKEIKDEFIEFLEEQHMALKQVGDVMPGGLSSLMDFNLLLGTVLDDTAEKKTANGGQSFSGFWADLPIGRMWVGINFDTPKEFTMAIWDLGDIERAALKGKGFKIGARDKNDARRSFALDEKFFDSSLEQQRENLSNFVKDTFDYLGEVLKDSKSASA